MALVKSLSGDVQVKSADRGEVTAVFATLNVIDKDGDVTFPGAFTDGEEVAISPWRHAVWSGQVPPIGEGRIKTVGDKAIFDGRFFLGMAAGREHFELVKARKEKQEWSYGFDTLHKPETVMFGGRKANALRKLKVYEVSPVWQGAGVGTATLAVKANQDGEEAATAVTAMEYAAAIRPHETPVTVKAWDSLNAPAELAADLTIDQLRSVHAYVDPTGDPSLKSSYGFLHHHGVGGDANLRACLAGIAELNGTKSAHLSPAERQAIHAHLAQHLEDGDRDVPELKDAADGTALKFNEEAADVLSRLSSLRARTSEVMALRRSKGKALSAQSLDVLDWIYDEMRGLKGLLDSPQETAAEEFARFVFSSLENYGETA